MSNIHSRAGLVSVLFVVLFISLVSALPIPTSKSGFSTLSTRSYLANGPDLIQRDHTVQFPLVHGPISTAYATPTESNSARAIDDDSQLFRRTSIAAKIRNAFKRFGQKIKSGFQKVGQKIKAGFQKFGQKVKTTFQKVGQKIKTGFQTFAKKAKTFFKTTGAKIVKFGLKVASVITKVVGKVVSFIPGIGKPIAKAMDGVAKVEDVVSDKIHVSLGKKLDKGMNVLNKADKVLGYIPRRRDLSDVEGFQQRDAYYFEESA